MIHRLRQQLRTARDSARYEGATILLWRLAVKALAPVVTLDHQILFEIDLTRPVEQRVARVPCTIEPATEADLEAIADAPYPPAPEPDWSALSDRPSGLQPRY